ncbi:MAG TPA: hypothetical protein VIM96_01800, partial [Pseudomonadales bacterium]
TCNSKFPRRMFNIAMTQHFNQNRQEQCIQSFVDSLTQNDAVTNTLFGPELINHPDPEVRRHITQPIAMEQEAYRRINALKNKP